MTKADKRNTYSATSETINFNAIYNYVKVHKNLFTFSAHVQEKKYLFKRTSKGNPQQVRHFFVHNISKEHYFKRYMYLLNKEMIKNETFLLYK